MPLNATLQDVADAAGVHRSTVSLALRDHPRISQAVRRRVQGIAKRLGYSINPLVSALMQSRRSRTSTKHISLAYITTHPTRYGWRPPFHDRPDFFPGAQERAKDFGYKLEDFWLTEPGMTPRRLADILTTRNIHGLIVGRLPPGRHSVWLPWERFSCVALGMTLREPALHHVAENYFDAAWQSMHQCIIRGYERIGFVFSEANDSPHVGERWLSAYFGQQLRLSRKDRIPVCPSVPANKRTFAKWFEKYRPDALLCTHARPVREWLQELKIAVPGETGLIDLAGDHPELNFSGVCNDPAVIGRTGVELLIGMLHRNESGVPEVSQEVLLKGEWREGTTLPPRKATAELH
ncbi:MAG TPA: LacI family DNA-binding transcriptional regulator [Opitutaceae bacterium]|nr:LacI family DNA-binding transcriptional regulator [Opitutaceae bacterium]